MVKAALCSENTHTYTMYAQTSISIPTIKERQTNNFGIASGILDHMANKIKLPQKEISLKFLPLTAVSSCMQDPQSHAH